MKLKYFLIIIAIVIVGCTKTTAEAPDSIESTLDTGMHERCFLNSLKSLFKNTESNILSILDNNLDNSELINNVANMNIDGKGYGMLMDENFNIIAHPSSSYLGVNLAKFNDGDSIKEELIKIEKNIIVIPSRNYENKFTLMYSRRVYNKWFLWFVLSLDEYTSLLNMYINE